MAKNVCLESDPLGWILSLSMHDSIILSRFPNLSKPSYPHRVSDSCWAPLVAQWLRIRLPVQERQVQSLGQEDPLEKEMATYSSILAWKILRTEEPSGLHSS